MKKKSLFLILLLLILFIPGSSVYASDPIRFGLHQNPPLNFTDDDGHVRGFAIDMLEYVALQEGWQIEYIPGDAAQSLKRLEVGEIDLFGAIAYSEKRTEHYDFTNEILITNWGQIYIHPGVDINSILDLESKKIAIIRNGIHTIALQKMFKSFSINAIFVEADDFPAVFNLIDRGEADAGVVNRLFAIQNESKYNVKELPIIFNPIEIRFATPKNKHQDLLTALDSHLEKLKADRGSVYYQSQNQWLKIAGKTVFPDWVIWVLGSAVGVIILFVGISILLKFQVSNRTRDIEEEIDERKRTENALQESEEKYRGLFNSIRDAILVTDINRNIISLNPAFSSLFGYTLEDLKGQKTVCVYENEEHSKELGEALKEHHGGKHFLKTVYYKKKNGDVFPGETGVFYLKDQSGEVIGFIGLIRDITERKQAEEALRKSHDKLEQVVLERTAELRETNEKLNQEIEERKQMYEDLRISEERFRLVFEEGPIGMHLVKPDFRIFSANNAFCKMLEYTEQELIDRPLADIIHPEDRKTGLDLAQKMRNGEIPGYQIERRYIKKNKKIVWTNLNTSVLRSKEGTALYGLGIVENITEHKLAEESLLKSERKFRTLAKSAPVGIFQTDVDGKCIYVNERWCEFAGLSPEEASGEGWVKALHPDDREKVFRVWHHSVKTGEEFALEYRFKTPGGKVTWLAGNSAALIDDSGETVGYLGTITDINERKRAEEALRESEEKYRSLFNDALDMIHIADSDGKIIDANPVELETMGYSRDEYIGKLLLEIIHPHYREKAKERLKSIFKGEEIKGYETAVVTKHGNTVYVEVNAVPQVKGGKIVSARAFYRDITDRKIAEEALQESEEKYKKLFTTGKDVIFLVDVETMQIVDVNPAAFMLYGYNRDEFLTKTPGDISAEPEKTVRAIKEGMGEGIAKFPKRYHKKKDGTVFPIEITASEFLLRGRRIHVAVIKDITERMRAEEEKKKLEAKLRQAQKMESVGTLAGGIAHDFNNILSPIFGYTEFAMNHIDQPARLKEDLDEVYQAAGRARDLVKQILTFSRIADQEKRPQQMSIVVKEAVKLLCSTIPTTIEIKQEIISQETVLADPTHIHQVVMNLCTNAYHAMRETGGTLSVALNDVELTEIDHIPGLQINPGRYLQLQVSDTGHGMDKKTLEKIFEPYFTTKEVDEGTGLGLAVVHGIVEDLNGFIHAYSEPRQGTTFHVYLPIIDTKAGDSPPKEEKGPLSIGKERIMVVDDEEKILKMAKEILTDYGYWVTAFRNGVQALQEFEGKPKQYDLVVTDMTMPYITGAQLAQKIMEIRPDMPIILCTGHSELVNREKALAMGIRAYVEKPLVMSILIKTIREVLDQEKSHAS